jgi:hypothetical protein
MILSVFFLNLIVFLSMGQFSTRLELMLDPERLRVWRRVD